MNKNEKYYDLIAELVKNHRKFPGYETILDDIIDDVYEHSKVIIKTISNEDVIRAYFEKVISTSIITVPKKLDFHKQQEQVVKSPEIAIHKEYVDKMINSMNETEGSVSEIGSQEEEPEINTEFVQDIAEQPEDAEDVFEELVSPLEASEIPQLNISEDVENETEEVLTIEEESSEETNIEEPELAEFAEEIISNEEESLTFADDTPSELNIEEPVSGDLSEDVENETEEALTIEEESSEETNIEEPELAEFAEEIISNEEESLTFAEDAPSELNIEEPVSDDLSEDVENETEEALTIEEASPELDIEEPELTEFAADDMLNADDEESLTFADDDTSSDLSIEETAMDDISMQEGDIVLDDLEINFESSDMLEENLVADDTDFASDITIDDSLQSFDSLDDIQELSSVEDAIDDIGFGDVAENPDGEDFAQKSGISNEKIMTYDAFGFEPSTKEFAESDKREIEDGLADLNNKNPHLNVLKIYDLKYNQKLNIAEISDKLSISAEDVVNALNEIVDLA